MLDDDAQDGGAYTFESQLDQTSAATVSKMLREALQIRFDDLAEFEDVSMLEVSE